MTAHPTRADILRRDRARVEFLQRKNPGPVAKIPATGGPMNDGNYVVKVGYGTPVRKFTVDFDTGSSRCWIQCKPCTSCYSQIDPIFDPSASSSYANIACGATQCTQSSDTVCSASSCMYLDKYGDGSTTKGNLATETLTLTPDDVFQDFSFGCGEDNEGVLGGSADVRQVRWGVLILSPLLAQLDRVPYLGQVFSVSYWLRRVHASLVATEVGTIVDSGTVITRLPQRAYNALRKAFRAAMSGYPEAPGDAMFDTCYDFSKYVGKDMKLPSVTLHFKGGVDLEVDETGILTVESGVSQVCLAFVANEAATDVVIIGNTQQKRAEVVFDVGKGRVGFRPGACT
ncbi:Aspartic proteinase nepenthesin-2 [Acorus gramineus]|uniref:Aspartic proteinase nepenthesin-2 n=1 Tax=Acorus gramineus TaxID=55184 RepID=A0AAV9A8Q8_ACOGR|nr:Aspartic proteinase nepenthesin-2 [Acorus gramineus]